MVSLVCGLKVNENKINLISAFRFFYLTLFQALKIIVLRYSLFLIAKCT